MSKKRQTRKKARPPVDRTGKTHSAKRVSQLETATKRIALQAGNDLAKLESKFLSAWELVWTALEIMKEELAISDDRIEETRKKVVGRWIEERKSSIKSKLESPQTLCEKCLHVGVDTEFANEAGDIKCPRCGEEIEVFFAPEKEVVKSVTTAKLEG